MTNGLRRRGSACVRRRGGCSIGCSGRYNDKMTGVRISVPRFVLVICFQISVYRSVQIGATGQKNTTVIARAFRPVAISRYNPKTIIAPKREVSAKICHALNILGHPTFYQEIATGLTALAMTVVVVTQLRRFKRSDKLKFEYLQTKTPTVTVGVSLLIQHRSGS